MNSDKEEVLLNNTVTSVMQPRAGLCPHGMPPSACPICSNMGGGGGKKPELNFKSSQLPVMSWNQCEAIGYFLKAQRRATEKQKINFKLLILQLQLQADNFNKVISRLWKFTSVLSQIPLGVIVAIPIKFVVIPVLQAIQNTFAGLIDVSDKIAAIFGEILKGLEIAKEKFNEFIKELKNKFFKLFEIFSPENNSDNNSEIREEKKIFNFNFWLKRLKRKQKGDEYET